MLTKPRYEVRLNNDREPIVFDTFRQSPVDLEPKHTKQSAQDRVDSLNRAYERAISA